MPVLAMRDYRRSPAKPKRLRPCEIRRCEDTLLALDAADAALADLGVAADAQALDRLREALGRLRHVQTEALRVAILNASAHT